MKWYEVIEDLGDGSSATRRFRTEQEAEYYVDTDDEWCRDGYECVDTDSTYFWDEIEEGGELK